MKKLLLLFLSFSLLNVCIAQDASPPDISKTFKYQGVGLYLVGPRVAFSSESRLNPLLHQNGYPGIRNVTLKFGLGVQYRIGMFVIDADANSSTDIREKENKITEIEHSVFSANFLLSYYLKKIDYNDSKTMYLYPFIGLSNHETTLYLTQSSTSQPINTLLGSPNNALHLKHYNNGFTFGAGLDICSFYDRKSGLVSIKIGYRFSIDGAVTWEAAPATIIPDAPRDYFNQFFLQLSLGGVFNW